MAEQTYVLNGPTLFPFPYTVLTKGNLVLQVVGGDTVPPGEWSVTGLGVNSAAVSIWWPNAPSDGSQLLIKRNIMPERLTNFQAAGGVRAAPLDAEFDHLHLAIADNPGPRGEQGEAGPAGAPGPQGPQGWTGEVVSADSQSYSGDGSTSQFTLPKVSSTDATLVFIDGVYQEPGTAYSVAGQTLTLTSPAPNTSTVVATVLGGPNALPANAVNVSSLRAMDTANARSVLMLGRTSFGDGGGGTFRWDGANRSSEVAADEVTGGQGDGGIWIAPAADKTGASGAWVRIYDGPVNVRWYGAVGNGVADDTLRIQAALRTKANVYLPAVENPATKHYKISAPLQLTVDGQVLAGDGWASKIVQTANNTNVIEATNLGKVMVRAVHAYAPSVKSSLSNGCGVAFFGCSESIVTQCYLAGGRSAGVLFQNTNDSEISSCVFVDSVVQDTDLHSAAGSDIHIVYSSSRNKVVSNTCISGKGIAINLQSINAPDHVDDNIVCGNIIRNARMYGVSIYRLDNTSSVERNKIVGNTIDTVTGSVDHEVQGPVYGAGIYNQGAEYTIISGNHIRNTNGDTGSETLSPGAIGINNSTEVTIIGNQIHDARWYGIAIFDPNTLGLSGGVAVVSGNTIRDATKSGIYVKDRGDVIITGNVIVDGGSNGIKCDTANLSQTNGRVRILGNEVRANSGVGITYTSDSPDVEITGNHIEGNGVHGLTVANVSGLKIFSNVARGNSSRGLQIQASCSEVDADWNTAEGNDTGFVVQARTRLGGNNRIENNNTDWSGDYGPVRIIPSGESTPNVEDGDIFQTQNSGSTTITGFSNGRRGQKIYLWARDNNTTVQHGGSIFTNTGATKVLSSNIVYTFINVGNWIECD